MMNSALYWCAATVLLFIRSQVHGADGDCNFYFITQPPEEIPCNPYSSSSDLMLECNIVGPDPDVSQPFDRVQWFRTLDVNNSRNELLRSEITTNIKISTTRIVDVSSMSSNVGFRSVLSIRRLNDMSTGTYWCQVQVEPNIVPNGRHFTPSTRTRLLPEADYSDLPTCAANTILLQLTVPVQCIDNRNSVSVPTVSIDIDPGSTLQTSSINHSLTVDLHSSELHTLLPACSPSTDIPVTTLGLSDSGVIVFIAVGVPTFIAFLILLLAVVLACRKKASSRHKSSGTHECDAAEVTTVQLQSSSDSITLASQTLGDGVSEAVVSAGLDHRLQPQNCILPPHLSVARQQSANTEYSEILARKERKATTLIGKLKKVCQQESNRMDAEPATQQLYRGLNTDSIEPMHEYNATMAQVGSHRVVHNGREYHIVDPNMPLFHASGGEYMQPQSTTLSSHHKYATKANLVPTQSDGEYVVPTNLGMQNGNLHYQGLKTDTQEYEALYMTPDMQPTPGMLDLNGHQYQLPDATSMDSPGVYAEPES